MLESEMDGTFYGCDTIKTSNRENIIDRNQRKVQIVQRLISLPKIWVSIPYAVYFFSSNLDHVLHNNANVPWEDKDKLATVFVKKYHHNPEAFLYFIQDDRFAIKKPYLDSWH